MRFLGFALLAMTWSAAAVADEVVVRVNVLPGHPIHRADAAEAGAVMALTIAPAPGGEAMLLAACEALRRAAGLAGEHGPVGEATLLEVIFVVPAKAMAIEGYYLPAVASTSLAHLVRGEAIDRRGLDRIVAAVGFPPHLLDEDDVEHEISCELDQPAWHLRWEDVRAIDGRDPQNVIERAYERFAAVHQSVVDHAATLRHPASVRATMVSEFLPATAAR